MSVSTSAAPALTSALAAAMTSTASAQLRVEGEREKEQPRVNVDADLHQHRRVQQRGDRGGGDARVRQPRVEGQGCRLGEHAHQEQAETPQGRTVPFSACQVEGACLAVDGDDADQHDQGAEGGDQERLVGPQHVVPAAVEADQAPAGDRR